MSQQNQMKFHPFNLSRRQLLKSGAAAGAAASVAAAIPGKARAAIYTEAYPTSPLILDPFTEPLPVPAATRPVGPGHPSAGLGLDPANHDSLGGRPHQVIPSQLPAPYNKDPLIYHLKLQLGTWKVSNNRVLPMNKFGEAVAPPPGSPVSLAADGTTRLPDSCIYGFAAHNGQDFVAGFPGAMINAEYGRPVMIRFENNLLANPQLLDRQDFGAPVNDTHYEHPEKGGPRFLTHLHNGHTAPESDGNPHYHDPGYTPGEYFDALYLNYPAGGQESEKQSFLWFHDHQHSHTGANVYKGMVGLFPIYDSAPSPGFPFGRDPGDETKGLRLPGVRTDNGDGSFNVKYDVPLAFYDYCADDGVTVHHDFHTGSPEELRPEWWGKSFFRHFPNHGFVGDIFTVNCKAFPVLNVDRRKYRFRMISVSVARCYEMVLMRSIEGPKSAASLGYEGEDLQGQYRLPDGQQCLQMTQIATDGGLMTFPVKRNTV